MNHLVRIACWLLLVSSSVELSAQEAKKPIIPHAQDKAPNEPRDPQTAAKMMTVPEGFSVEVVAAEPDIVNPVAMAIDERGRFWITESLEYPRREPGVGKDRVKILEDTDGDGKADKFSVFLDGLNIPSGVAVGHGGVWIANSPDILFVPDADRDGKPDGPAQVVVTGFGRTDTHELPNSLTWGPDGWLYGLNGVFNHSHVKYPKENPNYKEDHKGWPLTVAMYRIHPRTREFQVFCEGTSNPWGIAFNDEGEAFISACVIDHLWHLVETGYYHRQGGPYPPFTWKIDSIVKHKHQKAAYCGIHYFDSDAYPEKYRGKLYMGNIHGGCINVDRIERDGSTYKGFGEDDFLTANDAWFMPVVQKTGPDGCLYILDWYDRYHCYQDANRDPAGIDRLKGRLYRVRYKDSPRAAKNMDLAKETDDQLIERLGAKNDFIRWTATRILSERRSPPAIKQLSELVFNHQKPLSLQLHALWSLAGADAIDARFCRDLIAPPRNGNNPIFRAWGIRLAGNLGSMDEHLAQAIGDVDVGQTEIDLHPTVKLQLAIAQPKLKYPPLPGNKPSSFPVEYYQISALLRVLTHVPNDPLIQRVVWQNLHPLVENHADAVVGELDPASDEKTLSSAAVKSLLPRIAERILGRQKFDAKPVADLFALLRDDHPQIARQVIELLAAKVQSGELKGEKLDQLKVAMTKPLTPVLADGSKHALAADASLLAASWGDPRGLPQVRRSFMADDVATSIRLKALNSLIAAKDAGVIDSVAQVLDDFTRRREDAKNADPSSPLRVSAASRETFVADVLTASAKLEDPKVADLVLARFEKLGPSFQPAIVELLTQRADWSKKLLSQVGDKKIAATAININQARRIQALKDRDLSELLNRHWGQVRDTRNPDREKVVAEMKTLIRKSQGDPFAGEKVFKRVCAACHKIYGEGPEIGPDITLNGRNDFNQLLSNVFDPSLVIGAGYRVCTVVTTSGRVQSGLLVEDSPQRVVLKPAQIGSRLGILPDRSANDDKKPLGKEPQETTVGKDSQPTVQVAVGKLEVIPRDEIDEFKLSELSLMPEGLEKQLSQQEIVDLFAFITLDKHPSDKTAKRLPGVTAVTPRQSTNAAEFPALVAEILPGFTTSASGVDGVALLNNHFGRDSVLRTHPVSRDASCVLTQKVAVPAGKKTKVIVDVAHDPRGDWRLVIRGNGERLADEMINKETCKDGWRTITADLTKFAGTEVKLDLLNQANDWSFEFGYWGGVRIVSE